MSTPTVPGNRVVWYRSPLKREDLSALNKRSDLLAFLQTGGYLATLALTGTAAYLSVGRLAWPWVVLLLYVHGTCWRFMINGFHELVHDSVFKTRSLNRFFLCVLSFLGWMNHISFWASHTEHHKYTLHQPDDLEVVLPTKLHLKDFLEAAFISPRGFYYTLKTNIRLSRGKLSGEWEKHLFNDLHPDWKKGLSNWARFVLAGHLTILIIACIFHMWMLPVVISLAPFYGGGLFWLCNNTQHVGLRDAVPDYRLCCRTIYLNPVVRFLYWHMNYHTEHHMYAAVPCYRLGRLHALIKNDMPPCPRGLFMTWKQIIAILKRQETEPGYQYDAPLPTPSPAAPLCPVATHEDGSPPATAPACI